MRQPPPHPRALALAAGALLLLVLAVVAAPGRTAAAGPGRKAAAVEAPAVDPRALRCWDLGTTFGSAFMLLDERLRARGPILEAYCAGRVDKTLQRVPTEEDVKAIQKEIHAAVGGRGDKGPSGARMKTGPLDDQVRQGATVEEQMLDTLLK